MGDRTHYRQCNSLAGLKRLIIAWAMLGYTMVNAATVQVTDDAGHVVQLASPAQRIVSLSPHITELVYAAGAGDRLIATDSYSDYPPAAKSLPRVGTSGGLDREQLLMLQPDLVIAWRTGNKASDLRWLQQVGIAVYQSEPETLDDIAENILDIGVLADSSAAAQKAATDFRRALQSVCRSTEPATIRPTYYEIWPQPAMTIGGKHWLNQVLQLAHMENIFTDQPRAILNIEAEAALARPYQLKIVDPGRLTATSRSASMIIPGNSLLGRPGPRIIEGIKQLCQHSR